MGKPLYKRILDVIAGGITIASAVIIINSSNEQYNTHHFESHLSQPPLSSGWREIYIAELKFPPEYLSPEAHPIHKTIFLSLAGLLPDPSFYLTYPDAFWNELRGDIANLKGNVYYHMKCYDPSCWIASEYRYVEIVGEISVEYAQELLDAGQSEYIPDLRYGRRWVLSPKEISSILIRRSSSEENGFLLGAIGFVLGGYYFIRKTPLYQKTDKTE